MFKRSASWVLVRSKSCTRLSDAGLTTVRPTLGVTRDLVVFDPRGTGFSGPVLSCPEVDPRQSGEYDAVNSGVVDLQGRTDSLRRCRTHRPHGR